MGFISGSVGLVVQVADNYLAFWTAFEAFYPLNSSNNTYSAYNLAVLRGGTSHPIHDSAEIDYIV